MRVQCMRYFVEGRLHIMDEYMLFLLCLFLRWVLQHCVGGGRCVCVWGGVCHRMFYTVEFRIFHVKSGLQLLEVK
jgi:hypothetical protein